MVNGNGTYIGSEKRAAGTDRREHVCLHESDFGELKANVKNLGEQVAKDAEEQKDRNRVVDNKFDRVTSCLTQVTAAQELMPSKVVAELDKKKDERLKRFTSQLRNISTLLGILTVVGGGLYWLFTFITANAIALP